MDTLPNSEPPKPTADMMQESVRRTVYRARRHHKAFASLVFAGGIVAGMGLHYDEPLMIFAGAYASMGASTSVLVSGRRLERHCMSIEMAYAQQLPDRREPNKREVVIIRHGEPHCGYIYDEDAVEHFTVRRLYRSEVSSDLDGVERP